MLATKRQKSWSSFLSLDIHSSHSTMRLNTVNRGDVPKFRFPSLSWCVLGCYPLRSLRPPTSCRPAQAPLRRTHYRELCAVACGGTFTRSRMVGQDMSLALAIRLL